MKTQWRATIKCRIQRHQEEDVTKDRKLPIQNKQTNAREANTPALSSPSEAMLNRTGVCARTCKTG